MRVLLIEDEAAIAAEIARTLSGAGYVVDISTDGEDGWFRAESEQYGAIVLDRGLPQLDGLSVLRRLRDANVATPVLILTASGTWMERVEGIDAGADDYLVKPFHNEELLARLGAIIRRAAGHATPVVEAGGLRVDTRQASATLEGKPVSLTPLEYRALRYLAHNKGRPVGQSELSDHLYGDDAERDSNALEAMVARLRKKIGSDVITTRRGYGYVIPA